MLPHVNNTQKHAVTLDDRSDLSRHLGARGPWEDHLCRQLGEYEWSHQPTPSGQDPLHGFSTGGAFLN